MSHKLTRKEAVTAMDSVINYINGGHNLHTKDTAERFIKAWDTDWGKDCDFNFTTFPAESDTMVIELNIPFVSHCAHHLAPIVGNCHVAYLPKDKMSGLSKLNRTVENFASNLQVQENLTQQIADFLFEELEPSGLGVQMVAEHMCVSTRGVKHHGSLTVTTVLKGSFFDPEVKKEFFNAINTYGGKK
jgi:GTP cyclohydrolase I